MNHPATINNFAAQLQKRLVTPQALTALRNLLILLFLIWSCFTLARLFWLLVPAPALPDVPNITPSNTVTTGSGAPSASSIDLEPLLAAEIFGALDKNAPEPEVVEQTAVIEDAVETKLNLTLKGVIRSSIPSNSEAIIAHGRKEEVYKVGDSLPGGTRVKLVQVDSHRVILDNSGRTEALNLFDPSKVSSSSVSRAPSRRPGLTTPSFRRGVTRFEQSEDDGDIDSEAADGPDDTVTIKRPPKSLSDVIRFSVAREGGDIIGYKIRPGRDRDSFSELGLQNNDIVTEINGIALTDSGSVTKVYREMRTATSASVEILRDGQSLQLNIELDTEE